MSEQFEDWSPASVFGATSSERDALKRPSVSRESLELHQARLSSTEQFTHSSTSRDAADHLAVATAVEWVDEAAPSSLAQHVVASPNETDAPLSLATPNEPVDDASQCRRPRLRSPSSSLSLSSQLIDPAPTDAAMCHAAQIIQRFIQLLLLRQRERDALHAVDTLRSMLQHAASTLLVQSYRRYRSRCSIDAFLHRWSDAENRVQALLQHLIRRKRKREACVATSRARQRHKAQLAAQRRAAAACITHWWLATRCRRRQYARVAAAQRRIVRWLRQCCYVRRRNASNAKLKQRAVCCIQVAYRAARSRRRDCARQQRIVAGTQRLLCVLGQHIARSMFTQWLETTRWLQHIRDASARALQHTICSFAVYRMHVRRETSAKRIQSLFRGVQARLLCRQLRHQAHSKRKRLAATQIQRHVRGRQARCRVAKLLQQLRERFRCTNCGVLEPGGAYCKHCGRKRTTFDGLLDRHVRVGFSLSARNAPESHCIHSTVTAAARCSGQQRVPTRPTLSLASTHRPTIVRGSTIRHVSAHNNNSNNNTALVVGTSSSLPAVLSSRHVPPAVGKMKRLTKRPHTPLAHCNQIDALTPRSMQANALSPSLQSPEAPSAVHQTKLRAHALVALQAQQQDASHAHALAQHLHRLQKASCAVGRSR